MPVTVIATKPTQEVPPNLRYIDIGGELAMKSSKKIAINEKDDIVNLTDPVFRGSHHGKRKHDGLFTVSRRLTHTN